MQIQNLTLSTVEIAEMLDNTPHKDILKKLEGRNGRNGKHTKGYIEILTERQMSPSDFFFLSSYKDASGKENKHPREAAGTRTAMVYPGFRKEWKNNAFSRF